MKRPTRPSLAIAVALALAPRVAWADVPTEQQAVAATLFDQGRSLMDAERYEEACARFDESQRLDPSGGTLMNLAHCREREGRTRTAYLLYTEALSMARRDRRDDRVEICQKTLDELRARWATIKLVVPEGRPIGLVVKLNGALMTELVWGSELPLDAGEVVIEAAAKGHVSFLSRTRVKDGDHVVVAIPALREESPDPTTPAAERPRRGPETPSHDARGARELGETAWRPLALIRVDVDGALRGAVTHVGLGTGVTRFAEVTAGALIGSSKGFEIGARGFIPLGVWRPFVSLAAPCFVEERAHVGVRAGAGLEWSVHRNLAVFGQVGAAYFPQPSPSREAAALLPALGIVGRI